jgi:hypothetical protein
MNFKCMHAVVMFCIILSFSKTVSAKVWRVNNNAGVSADFAQVSAAVSSAAVQNDDTIYVEGSSTSYSNTTINKRLVIIGAGYFLSENTGLQANVNESWISLISIDSLGSGSTLMGIRTGQVFTNSNPDNITISRCHLSISTNNSVVNSKLSNWVISKSQVGGLNFGSAAYVFENLQVVNCFINSSVNIASNINSLFRNNIFFNHVTLNNSYIANNIFLNFPTLAFTNCTVKYNFAQSNVLPAGNNNQNSIPQATLFTLTGSTDDKYQLKTGSPAIGAGEPVNGITPDAGPFGTADPYRLSGIPPIPTIYALTVPASVPTSATTMTIKVSTRSNN